MSQRFDAIVIGTGQAGPSLAARLVASGQSVAVVERHRFGGTCVNNGCTPTKALVASARAAYMARRGADFGVEIDGSIAVDMQKVKARKDALVRRSTDGIERWLKKLEGCTVFEGHARFEGPHTIRVGNALLEGDKIFINVGARPFVPDLPGLDAVDYFTSSSIMGVDFLPEHLVIIGGSYIGLEFGQMYRRFGSEVTIIEMGPRLIRRDDEDVSEAVREMLEVEGINIRLDAECITLERKGNDVVVGVDCEAGDRQVVGSHVLLAVGRRPNTHDLGLEQTAVKVDDRGFVVVDDQLRTTQPGVWALGDCNGQGAFTHTSYNDFEIVAANLLDDDPRRVSDRISCYGLYTDPPLGRAGMTEAQVRSSGRKALVGKRAMTRISRAVEKDETHGFMKFLIDAESKEILGAAILGVGGDEIIASILNVMYAKAPYTVVLRSVQVHPTVAELIPTTLDQLEPLS